MITCLCEWRDLQSVPEAILSRRSPTLCDRPLAVRSGPTNQIPRLLRTRTGLETANLASCFLGSPNQRRGVGQAAGRSLQRMQHKPDSKTIPSKRPSTPGTAPARSEATPRIGDRMLSPKVVPRKRTGARCDANSATHDTVPIPFFIRSRDLAGALPWLVGPLAPAASTLEGHFSLALRSHQ